MLRTKCSKWCTQAGVLYEMQQTVYTSGCYVQNAVDGVHKRYVRNTVDGVNKQALCRKCRGWCTQASVMYKMQYIV